MSVFCGSQPSIHSFAYRSDMPVNSSPATTFRVFHTMIRTWRGNTLTAPSNGVSLKEDTVGMHATTTTPRSLRALAAKCQWQETLQLEPARAYPPTFAVVPARHKTRVAGNVTDARCATMNGRGWLCSPLAISRTVSRTLRQPSHTLLLATQSPLSYCT